MPRMPGRPGRLSKNVIDAAIEAQYLADNEILAQARFYRDWALSGR